MTWIPTARPLTDGETARYNDLKLARKLIGDTPAERLAWIIAFTAEDPRTWHSATRTAYGDSLLALGGLDSLFPPPAPLAPKEVDGLHAELRQALRALVTGERVDFPTDDLSEGAVLVSEPGAKPARFARWVNTSNPRTAVFQALKQILESPAGARLLVCPGCGAAFVAVRRQRFCTERCAQRARNERKAERAQNVPATTKNRPRSTPRQPTRQRKTPR